MLNFAIRQGYLTRNPVKGVKFLDEGPGFMRVVSHEEQKRYLHKARPCFVTSRVSFSRQGCGRKRCSGLERKMSTLTGAIYSSPRARRASPAATFRSRTRRSEEHTSELQSRLHLVCRLLLEKKTQPKGADRPATRRQRPLGVRGSPHH